MSTKGTLHFFCGKMAAGKSTKAAELAKQEATLLFSEDQWLGQIYPEEIQVFDDYIKYSARLKPLLKKHIQQLLRLGISVIMDFPGNTRRQRAWFKTIFEEGDFPHQLHYIEASDALCIQQLAKRSQGKEGQAFTTEAEFHQVTKYFQSPQEDEGFNIKLHQREE